MRIGSPYWMRSAILLSLSILISFSSLPPVHAASPTVVNVSSTSADGIYGVGDVIDITVTFSQQVNVTSTPILVIQNSSSSTTNANYISGSGTSSLVFRFTAPSTAATADLDYASTNSLTGTIKNTALESAILTLPVPGSPGSLGANKTIQFESFESYVSGISSPDGNHLMNMTYSSEVSSVLSSFGNKIVKINSAADTRTIILDTGATIQGLQAFGDSMYWISGSTIYKSSLNSPSKSTLHAHSTSIAGFSRTKDYWVFVDSSRNLYRLTADANLTKTFVTTLSGTIVDYTSWPNEMATSVNLNKVLWMTLSSGKVYEIDVSNGTSSLYADLTKCTTSIRGMVRLGDGSEIYGAYSPTSKLTRRWTDGRISCSRTSFSPWMFGGLATDGTYLFAAVYGATSSDYRIGRYTPSFATWSGLSTYDPASLPAQTTISIPSLVGGGSAFYKGVRATVSVSTSIDGRVTFKANGKNIPGCIKVRTVSLSAECSFKPAVQGTLQVQAIFIAPSSSFSSSVSTPLYAVVSRRITTR